MQRPLPMKERDPVRHRLARKCPSPRGRSGQAVVLTDESQVLFFDEVLRANLAGREASLPYPPADGLGIAARSSGDLGDREHDCRILQPGAPTGFKQNPCRRQSTAMTAAMKATRDLVVTAQRVIGDFWSLTSLTQSQVYRELSAMADAGYVEAGERGRRDRKPYAITEAGRAAFAAWIRREPGPETIRFPLLLTLAFVRHVPPERLSAFLANHRAGACPPTRRVRAAPRGRPESQRRPRPVRPRDPGVRDRLERAVLDWFDRLT